MTKDGITMEQLEKSQNLLIRLSELVKKQNSITLSIVNLLNEYSDWLLEQVKENR